MTSAAAWGLVVFGVWLAGFLATAGVLWLTGGEKHVSGGRQLLRIWFHTAVWPWTWGVILLSVLRPRAAPAPKVRPAAATSRPPAARERFVRATVLEPDGTTTKLSKDSE